MKIGIGIIVVLLAAAVAHAQTETPAVAGMYSQSGSDYTRMELATNSGFKVHGAWKTGLSYGVAHTKGTWLYRGSHAQAQLGSRPTFRLVSQIDVSTQAVALVRFEAKKDHREAQYCEVNIWSGVKEENKDVIPLTVARQPNTNNLTITPTSDLPAGEYLLIADQGKGADGYDFLVK